jgi:subtilisin family serine protease
MHTQKVKTNLFRLFAVMVVLAMAFAQVSSGARAQGTTPPKLEREKVVVNPVSLAEVLNYDGHLTGDTGPVGVVVEMEDTPAALLYAQNPGSKQARALTINQVSVIQKKQAGFMSGLKARGISATELYRTQKVYNGIWMRIDRKDLETLASIPGIKALHPMIPKKIDNTSSVTLIGAPQVWGGSGEYQGEDITIGVIDTGIDYIHTNFGGTGIYVGQNFTTIDEAVNAFPTAKVVGGYDFAGDDYDADISYFSTPSPDPDPMDCNGHGSHVSGTAAGLGVLPDGSTYVEDGADTYAALMDLTSAEYTAKFRIGPGVAPKAQLYALRVFGCEGTTNLTEQAIEWAMDPNGDGDLSDHLDVINMSLGSSYGSEYDTSAVASNNAALAGVIVVASAGNEADSYYITGAPAVATRAISVASSVDESNVFSAIEVYGNTAATPAAPDGTYFATEAVFGPQIFDVAGELAYASPANGCDPADSENADYPLTGVDGMVALIDRGVCSFDVKVHNAQLGGAIGVVMANNRAALPITMGGSDAAIDAMIEIPSNMINQDNGTALKIDLAAGTLNVYLSNTFHGGINLLDPAIVDTVSDFSSRGPGRTATLLKPDISAPGDTIWSTWSGSRDQGTNYSGTSMAAPHITGVMALLRQIHPTWTVAELKALVMNTATNDLWTSAAHTAVYPPTRVGAGRVSVSNAAEASVIAYNTANPEQVSLSFGQQAVLGTQSFTKSITIQNTGAADVEYLAVFENYYQDNPGLTFVLLDASDVSLDHPVTIPAGGTLEIKVKVTADATKLTKSKDASVSSVGVYGYRQFISEGGGYVTLTSTDSAPTLRVPVHIAARPASAMSTLENRIALPAAATGTLSLTPAGTPVDTVDDGSLVSVLELLGTDPNEASSTGINNAADIQYIGGMTDYGFYPFADASMYFGISTYGKWDSPNTVEFDIYIDVNEDGNDDFALYNASESLYTGATDDVMYGIVCDLSTRLCDAFYYVNAFSGRTNTNLFNNNVMTLVMPLTIGGKGLVEGTNTDFNFYVVSYSREAVGAVDVSSIMSYDVANPSFIGIDPVYTGIPMWYDIPGLNPTIDLDYDKAAIAANHTKGLLLLHHHNVDGTTAQVLTFDYHYFLPFIGR